MIQLAMRLAIVAMVLNVVSLAMTVTRLVLNRRDGEETA
jgi:hypothetical protein